MSSTPTDIASGAQAILQACESYVPAGANMDAAIEAHRLAFEQFLRTRDESDRQLPAFAIRVVILAATKTLEQAQRQVDYLTSLPIEAWEGLVSGDAAEVREETLAGCARTIALMTEP
jgi:hypothetical protein